MVFDNNIIIDKEKNNSGKIMVSAEEPAVLIRSTGIISSNQVKLKLLRKTKNGNIAFNEINISPVYQKVKVFPYEWIELEIPIWRGIDPKAQFQFKVITGTNQELLFYEINETITSFNSDSDRKKFSFTIGNTGGSFISVSRNAQNYHSCVWINNNEFRIKNESIISSNTCLETIFLNIHSNVEANKEQFSHEESSSYRTLEKERNFNTTLNKHFRPLIY